MIHRTRITDENWLRLVALLRRPGLGVGTDAGLAVGSEAERDRPFMDRVKGDHPGLARSLDIDELVSGEAATDRWIHVVILRGIQIMVAARGWEVLMLGGLEAFLVVHRSLVPLAVRGIPPHPEILFAPQVTEGECEGIELAIDAGTSATLTIVADVAKRAPMPADDFAEHVWHACRGGKPAQRSAGSSVDPERVAEYLALSRGRPRLQQLEMALALSERVLTGKRDKPADRQVQAAAAAQIWCELGSIEWAHVDPHSAARDGWSRVASLAITEEPARQALVTRLRDAMSLICQDAPIDIEVGTSATVRVYRFHRGQRSLIDRRGGTRGRVH